MFLLREEGTSKKRAMVRDLTSEGLLTVALVLVLFFAFLSFGSMGWFAENRRVSAETMSVTATNSNYTLLVERTDVYDELHNGDPVYAGIAELKTLLRDEEGYSLTATSTGDAPRLAYELTNEAVTYVEGDEHYYVMPGSYGTMTFYIKPNGNGDIEDDLTLELGCYRDAYDEFDNPVIRSVTNDHVLRLLQGHFLFFTERTGATPEEYQYSGLITDNTIHFSSRGKTKVPGKDYYEIKLYWEWPLTYFDIDEGISTTTPAVTRKYPAELRDYIEANRDAFFAANENSNVVDLLNDGYNDGDQTIGVNADYFVAFICNA